MAAAPRTYKLVPLPYLDNEDWHLWDCKEPGNVFIVRVPGHLPALFHVKDVDRFLEFFGGKRDTDILFVERSITVRHSANPW